MFTDTLERRLVAPSGRKELQRWTGLEGGRYEIQLLKAPIPESASAILEQEDGVGIAERLGHRSCPDRRLAASEDARPRSGQDWWRGGQAIPTASSDLIPQGLTERVSSMPYGPSRGMLLEDHARR